MVGLEMAQAAGAVVTVAALLSTSAPPIAFRLARLRLPQLPTGASDLSEDIEPYPGPQLMAGAVLADTYLTWMSHRRRRHPDRGHRSPDPQGGGVAFGMTTALGVVLLIRSRGLTSAWQRVATLLPALTGLFLRWSTFRHDRPTRAPDARFADPGRLMLPCPDCYPVDGCCPTGAGSPTSSSTSLRR